MRLIIHVLRNLLAPSGALFPNKVYIIIIITNPTLTKRPKYMKPILQYYLGCTEKPSQQPEEIQALAKELAEKESNAKNIETNFMDMYMTAWLMVC